MTRRLPILAALVLTAGLSVHLYRDTRYMLRARESVAELLGVEGRQSKAGVLIVLQPEVCLRSGELIERWNTLYRGGRVPVTALIVGSGSLSKAQRDVFEEHRIALPLRPIRVLDARILGEKLGYTSTPFAIVLDREGRVAGSFPGIQNVPVEALEALVGRGI